MAELKPCPFCGNKTANVFDWLGKYFGVCQKCDARTSSYATEEPTKEQIETILSKVRDYLLQTGNIFDWTWEGVVTTVIAEWEKIRS